MKRIIFLNILFFSYAQLTYCQRKFSLQQCLDLAYRQNFDIKNQELTILQAENIFEQSKKNTLPSLSVNTSQLLNSGRSIDPFSNTFVLNSINSNSFGVTTNWNIYNGFSLRNQIAQNYTNLQAEHFEILHKKKDLKSKISMAYLQVLQNQELWKISQELESNFQKQRQSIIELVNLGNRPQTDIIDIDAQIAMASYEALVAKNNIYTSKLVLAQLLGIEDFGNFEIESIKIDETLLNEKTREQLLGTISNLPWIRSLSLKEKASSLGVKVAEAAKMPNLSFSAGLATTYSSVAASEFAYFQQLNYNMNQFYRLSLNIPIFSNGQVKAKINTASINRKIIQNQYQQAIFQIRQEIEQAYFAAQISKEKMNSAKINLNFQNSALNSAIERFRSGLLNIIEMNTFQLNNEKAKSNFVQAQYEYYFRRLILDYYLD